MSRTRAILRSALMLSAVVVVADARAQQAAATGTRQEQLRRLDDATLGAPVPGDPTNPAPTNAGQLAGGGYGVTPSRPAPIAGGDYGMVPVEQPQIAGGDYGGDLQAPATQPTRPGQPGQANPTIAPSLLSSDYSGAPAGFRRNRLRGPRPSPDEAYPPVGVKAGSFIVRPSIETAAGYDDNPERAPSGGKGSSFLRLRGDLDAESDWSRHALGLRSSAQIRKYATGDNLGLEPELNAALTGRVDISEKTQINTELRSSLIASRPGDPETPNGVDGDEISRSVGATLGVAQRFNRLSLRLDGLVDRYTVDDSKLKDGSTLDNADRAYNSYQARLRGSYELSPRLQPYVEVSADTRDYDKSNAAQDPTRKLGSDGYTIRGGAQFEMTRLVTGEASLGYGRQTPKDGGLPPVEGLLVDGAIAWTPTALTTVRLSAKSELQETALTNASGILDRSFEASIQHQFRRNFSMTGRVAFERADYKGSPQTDDYITLGLRGEYDINRSVALTGSLERVWLKSSTPAQDYVASIIEFGLKFRR